MNISRLLMCAVLLICRFCDASQLRLSVKSGAMDDVPLRLVPFWRETPDDGRFSGCLVTQDRMSPVNITNDQSDVLWEFSADLSLDAVKGPYAPRVWNVAVNVRRYEPKHRIRLNGESFYEDLVCGSGFGICPVPMEPFEVATGFRWLPGLTENERVIASGSVIMGKSLRLEDGREVVIRWYPDRARTVVSYAIAVWPWVPGKVSVYTASQDFNSRCALSGRDAARTIVVLDNCRRVIRGRARIPSVLAS